MIGMVLIAAEPARVASTIPFRTEAAVPVATYALALVVTLVVLGVLVAMVALMRRKGWLGVMGAMPGMPTKVAQPIEIKASRRLSINTGVHVVAFEGKRFLIVESARSTQSSITPLDGPAASGGDV